LRARRRDRETSERQRVVQAEPLKCRQNWKLRPLKIPRCGKKERHSPTWSTSGDLDFLDPPLLLSLSFKSIKHNVNELIYSELLDSISFLSRPDNRSIDLLILVNFIGIFGTQVPRLKMYVLPALINHIFLTEESRLLDWTHNMSKRGWWISVEKSWDSETFASTIQLKLKNNNQKQLKLLPCLVRVWENFYPPLCAERNLQIVSHAYFQQKAVNREMILFSSKSWR
jgi:hypothetical protein